MPETSIISLPPQRWREAKELRLEALLAEPSAFASSYEDELAFGDDVWRARLSSAAQRDGNMTFFAEVDGALIGMAGAGWGRSPDRPKERANIAPQPAKAPASTAATAVKERKAAKPAAAATRLSGQGRMPWRWTKSTMRPATARA